MLITLIIGCSSYQVYQTCGTTLNNSRELQRLFNLQLLEHDSLDIYWYGFRLGPMLINYPIQEYYFLDDMVDFFERTQDMLGNF